MNFKRIVFCFFMLFLFQIPVFADVINFNSLPEAVSSEDLDKEYSFNGTQTIEVNLGELKGHLLTINGTQNVNSVINSTGTNGITLSTTSSSSQHLIINNVSGFDNFKSAIVNNKSISSVTINNSAFNNNGRSLKGSAVYNLGYIDVNNSTFSLNFSSYGGAVINGDGAVSGIQKSSKANLNNVLFENNTAQTGGAIVNDVNSTIYMNDVSFSSNTAIGRDDKYGGGAIANKGKIIMMKDSSFVDNESNISGGAIENSETLNIYGFTEFTGNKARQNGGAIFNSDYKNIATYTNFVNISSGANFKDNSAKNGGAIDNDGALFLTANTHEITFINNTASNFGGAIYNHIYSTVDLKTTDTNKISFTNNTATGKGGAIYNESGILNLIADTADIEFTDNIANDISNAIHTNGGTINLWTSENADIVFNDRITSEDGTSILNINASTTTVTAKGKISLNEDMRGYTGIVNLYDGQLELQEGNKFFDTDNFTIHGGTFTANANDILKDFTNNGTVNFIGGTNSNSISGNGTTIIDGEVLNNSTIANAVTINEGKKLTTGVDAITGVIENNGELLFNSDGTNSNSISGNGTTIIDGEVLNNSTIANAVTINEGKKLTTRVDAITGVIENNGELLFNSDGTNSNSISGNGTTIIDGEVLNNSTIANAVTINEGKKLTTGVDAITGTIENNGELLFNSDGTNSNSISGNGTTIIDGEVLNNSTIANAVTINEGKKLTTGVDAITGVIENNGELLFNSDGTNSNSISGNGTTIIDGEVLNNSTIANAVTINEGKKLTTGVDAITGVIENNGELLFNSDGTNSNSISGNGTTIIDGEVLNNSTIANAVTINTEKKLTTSASDITGEILNNGTLNFIGGINNNTITGINGILIINDNLENNFAIEQSSITINGVVINNSNISTENMYLDGTFYIGANGSFFTAINSTVYDGSEINLQNNLIQEHNFGNLTIEPGFVNLVVDADLENKQMDTISANDESSINGTINIKALNILTDTKEIKTEVLFTSSTVLQDKISSINTASSKLYKYNVFYNDGYFSFINVRGEINPVIAESAIAASVGGFATQTNILGQVFSSIDTQIMSRNQAKKRSVLYAAASNSVFDIENKIERNLWIRPYAVQETVKFNDIDVDNTAIGTLAGIDLVTSEESLVSFYLGYAGSNQKYEDIKINQTGYVLGATGMLIKEKLYAGLTGNINFNKAESQSDYGTDSFDMNMYSIGAKTGYNFDLSDKFILEPNLTLMYGNVSNQEYETTQGAKIDSQSNTNIVVQPQVKAKFSFENGWQPYGLLGYIANISDKTKVVVDGIEFETDKINGYVEYGAGVNKDFIGTVWSCYAQVTGRSGGRNGFAGNLGIKYKF